MKKTGLVLALVPLMALAGCKCMMTKKAPKEAPAAEAASAEPGADEMAAWMAYMTPGDEHARLASHVGSWKVHSRIWEGPDAEPMESVADAEISMILGGRYQEERWVGTMMGMPFEGRSTTGYDNATHEFTSIWMDTMGTGTAVTRGKRGANGVIEMHGEMVDPMGGTAQVRMFLTEDPDGSPNMEMWMTSAKHGREFKMMELDYEKN